GYTDLAGASVPEDSPVMESLEAIRAAVTSAAALTAQLLTFSRRQIVTRKVVDLHEMLPAFSKLLGRLVEETVRLDVVLGRQLPPIRIDPSQLEQVVLSLVVNARDAMPQGGTITIRTGHVTVDEQAARHGKVSPGSYV